MREVLFRGKRMDNGKWTYGAYLPKHKLICLEETKPNSTEYIDLFVIPETVGQYTGLTDKNGTNIFEGDICKDSLGVIFDVEWDETNGRFLGIAVNKKVSGNMFGNKVITYIAKEPRVEVIGNIHDNPELLKGGGSDA